MGRVLKWLMVGDTLKVSPTINLHLSTILIHHPKTNKSLIIKTMFFSKIKDLTRFVSPKKDLIDIAALQSKLNDGLLGTMEKTFQTCMAERI